MFSQQAKGIKKINKKARKRLNNEKYIYIRISYNRSRGAGGGP
jgi:nitrogen regulatory protein PII-like uncharacterized protein